MTEKLCVVCKHFMFAGPTRDYSDLTPGDELELGCRLCIWAWDGDENEHAGADWFRKMIRTAETCDRFEVAIDR